MESERKDKEKESRQEHSAERQREGERESPPKLWRDNAEERERQRKKEKKERTSPPYQEQRVQHKADRVVHRLESRKGLVSALVGLDPQSGEDRSLQKPIAKPSEAAEDNGIRRGGDFGDARGGERREGRGKGEVESKRERRARQRALEAVSGDCFAEGSDGEWRRRSRLTLGGVSGEGPEGGGGIGGKGFLLVVGVEVKGSNS